MIFRREEIVIGSSIEAVLYAFINDFPLFYSAPVRPFRFDYFPPDTDLSILKVPATQSALTTFGPEKLIGASKYALWERLLFIMSLAGRVPVADLCSSMHVSDGRALFSAEYAKLAEVEFDKCHYFGDEACGDFLVEEALNDATYLCYDWVAFNRGGKHEIDYLSTNDDFVKEVWFYPSDRIDGKTQVKDACVISHLHSDQIEDFNYSETTARFKLVHEMEARGMKGLFNGFSKNGNAKYYKFRTSYIARRMARSNRSYRSSSPKIRIATETEETLLENLHAGVENYHKIIRYL